MVWVIEHPEGVIVIDTGETVAALQPEYFACDPVYNFLMQRAKFLKLDVTSEQEIGPQLAARGIAVTDVRWVVMTHLHLDHADGLATFPHAEIVIARAEYENQQRRPIGALTCRWPTWFQPRLIEYGAAGVGPFATSFALTRAGDVQLVPTPGHSYGHQSLILNYDGVSYFFAGDASFDQQQMLAGTTAGICYDVSAARHSLERIRQYTQQTPTVYLPSHDVQSAHRLQQKLVSRST
jgi:glyoxylase-like metal-dependent hydrolase (beta-lactamase superfamily II)